MSTPRLLDVLEVSDFGSCALGARLSWDCAFLLRSARATLEGAVDRNSGAALNSVGLVVDELTGMRDDLVHERLSHGFSPGLCGSSVTALRRERGASEQACRGFRFSKRSCSWTAHGFWMMRGGYFVRLRLTVAGRSSDGGELSLAGSRAAGPQRRRCSRTRAMRQDAKTT